MTGVEEAALPNMAACHREGGRAHLVLVCALRELLELSIQDGELPGDALDPRVQPPVLAVLCVEVRLIGLPLLRRANHQVLPVSKSLVVGV